MGDCVPAPACKAALAEADQLWPGRNKASDGICGDARHQARKSDHNTGNAFDLTHDPAHGVDCNRLAEYLRQRVLMGQEPRVKYVIWSRRIFNPSISPDWRPYTGPNPHDKHMHVSILADQRNITAPWWSTLGKEVDEMTDADRQWIVDQVRDWLSRDLHGAIDYLIQNVVVPRTDFLSQKIQELEEKLHSGAHLHNCCRS